MSRILSLLSSERPLVRFSGTVEDGASGGLARNMCCLFTYENEEEGIHVAEVAAVGKSVSNGAFTLTYRKKIMSGGGYDDSSSTAVVVFGNTAAGSKEQGAIYDQVSTGV